MEKQRQRLITKGQDNLCGIVAEVNATKEGIARDIAPFTEASFSTWKRKLSEKLSSKTLDVLIATLPDKLRALDVTRCTRLIWDNSPVALPPVSDRQDALIAFQESLLAFFKLDSEVDAELGSTYSWWFSHYEPHLDYLSELTNPWSLCEDDERLRRHVERAEGLLKHSQLRRASIHLHQAMCLVKKRKKRTESETLWTLRYLLAEVTRQRGHIRRAAKHLENDFISRNHKSPSSEKLEPDPSGPKTPEDCTLLNFKAYLCYGDALRESGFHKHASQIYAYTVSQLGSWRDGPGGANETNAQAHEIEMLNLRLQRGAAEVKRQLGDTDSLAELRRLRIAVASKMNATIHSRPEVWQDYQAIFATVCSDLARAELDDAQADRALGSALESINARGAMKLRGEGYSRIKIARAILRGREEKPLQEAYAHALKAMHSFHLIGDDMGVGWGSYALGTVFRAMGMSELAILCFWRAAVILQRVGASTGFGFSLFMVANSLFSFKRQADLSDGTDKNSFVHKVAFDSELITTFYEWAEEIFRANGCNGALRNLQLKRGIQNRVRGNLKQAQTLYEAAIKADTRFAGELVVANAKLGKAAVMMDQGLSEEGLEGEIEGLLYAAEKSFIATSNSRGLAYVQIDLGRLKRREAEKLGGARDLERQLEKFDAALECYDEAWYHASQSSSLRALAYVYWGRAGTRSSMIKALYQRLKTEYDPTTKMDISSAARVRREKIAELYEVANTDINNGLAIARNEIWEKGDPTTLKVAGRYQGVFRDTRAEGYLRLTRVTLERRMGQKERLMSGDKKKILEQVEDFADAARDTIKLAGDTRLIGYYLYNRGAVLDDLGSHLYEKRREAEGYLEKAGRVFCGHSPVWDGEDFSVSDTVAEQGLVDRRGKKLADERIRRLSTSS